MTGSGQWRRTPKVLRWIAFPLGIAGFAATVAGAVLPWSRFWLFGTEFRIPGVAGVGAATLAFAVLTVVYGRRFPLLAVALGVAIAAMAQHAHVTAGPTVKGRMLNVQQSLGPVNDRLMRVALPPIEPFDLGRPWADFAGPGPLWSFWGGAGLALAGAVAFAGERLGRTCPRCSARWPVDRAVTFCPACGERVGPLTACPTCASPLAARDRFCSGCGTAVPE